MKRYFVATLLVILVAVGLAGGYLAGTGFRQTTVTTSSSTLTSLSTIFSTQTATPLTSASTIEATTTTTTSATTAASTITVSSGEPIPVADIESANLSLGADFPGYLAVNPGAGRVYDIVGTSLIVIDASTHSVVASVTLPSGGSGLTVDPTTGTVFVSIQGGIAEVNGSTNTVVDEMHVNSGFGSLAFNPSTHTIYASGGRIGSFGANGSLIGLDVRTGSVVANISLTFIPYDLALNPQTDMVYAVGCHQEGLVCDAMASVVNGTSQAVVATVSLDSAYYPSMTYDQATNVVYASGAGELVALNGTTGAKIFQVNPDTCGPFLNMAIIPSLDQVLMVPQNYDYLLIYDGTSGALVNMYSYSSSLQSAAYNPDTHELYLTTSSGEFLAFPDYNTLGNVDMASIGFGQGCLPV